MSVTSVSNISFEKPHLVPSPAKADWKLDRGVEFRRAMSLSLACGAERAECAEWLRRHIGAALELECEISEFSSAGGLPQKEGAYRLEISAAGVAVSASGMAGVRHAFQTLRQIAVPARGTMTVEGWIFPVVLIEDAPEMVFRGMHVCWFPETPVLLIERVIRLAALYKFNYIVLEPWGTFRSERFPWFGWPGGAATKEEIGRLRKIAGDLGVILIPQLNIFGHAAGSRFKCAKHAVLDLNKRYLPLFEPHAGWNWCLSNPEAHKVIDGLVAEMHEAFGNPPFFHIGCDEANEPSCPVCRSADYVKLVGDNIAEVTALLEKRGARPMMWHDMLLKKGEWGRFYADATRGEERLLETLSRRTVICDYFYNEGVSPEGYPTFAYFKNLGFDTLTSPWESWSGTDAQGRAARKEGLFGLLGTTWHHLYRREMACQFVGSACAAWGEGEVDSASFADHWRMTGWDSGVTSYSDCGLVTEQIPSVTNPEIKPGL